MNIEIGDHLVSPRCGYTHHGLYIGNGNVIHYGGYAKIKSDGVIVITSLNEFSQNNTVQIRQHNSRLFSREESVERAYTRLGEDWYNILLNNCEHFVNWCINGLPISRQVNNVILSVVAYKALTKATKSKVIPSLLPSTITAIDINGQRAAQLPRFAVSASGSRLISAGIKFGLADIATGLSGGSASGIVVGATSIATPLAPLVAVVAVGWLVDCGIRKLFN